MTGRVPASPTGLSVQDRVRAFEEACNADGLDGYAALFAPDVETSLGTRTTRGRDAVVRTFAVMRTAFPDLVVTFVHVVISGDEVAVELVERGTHLGPLELPGRTLAPTGRRIDLRGAAFFRYDSGGLIATIRDYPDLASLRQQLGS